MDYQHPPEGSELERKLQLYSAAVYLFNDGKSHPQIVKLLSGYENDTIFLTSIVDKAMREEWDELFEYSRQLFAEGKTYDEVIRRLSENESDQKVVAFVCDKWYEWKTELLEHVHEAPQNIMDGSLWVLGCGAMVAIQFIYQWSLFSKIIWITGLIASLIQFLAGIAQRRVSNAFTTS